MFDQLICLSIPAQLNYSRHGHPLWRQNRLYRDVFWTRWRGEGLLSHGSCERPTDQNELLIRRMFLVAMRWLERRRDQRRKTSTCRLRCKVWIPRVEFLETPNHFLAFFSKPHHIIGEQNRRYLQFFRRKETLSFLLSCQQNLFPLCGSALFLP